MPRPPVPPDLVPHPRKLRLLPGITVIGRDSVFELPLRPDAKERLAIRMVKSTTRNDREGQGVRVRIASLPTLGRKSWLSDGQRRFLESVKSGQAYVLAVGDGNVTVVGKGPIGALYGAQTLLQLLEGAEAPRQLRNMEIRDFPAVEERYLAIPMTWYAGYGRVGFGSQLWGREQWLWFVDWCLAHKVNGINLCMYGYYPFRFDEYPESVFRDIETRTWVGEAGREATVRYTHPDVVEEFLPEVIRYARARGISVLCYWGLNTFNGGYALAHPESRYFSDDPSKFHQFRYNLCPSRKDVRKYFDASVRRILELGFDGFVLEESEGSGFCECGACRKAYYDETGDSRAALHKADYELFNHLYSVIRKNKPRAIVGIRAWRMGSETGTAALREGASRVPPDVPVFWSNGMDRSRFRGWIDAFGPARIKAQDCEALGFSALYDGLIYMFPRQYSSYLRYVDPAYRPEYPQSLPMDVKQYRDAARTGCAGVTGYAFNWNGWELAPMSLAQYGWNPEAFTLGEFVERAYRHQFGDAGGKIARAVTGLPLVLETRIAEGFVGVPRDDPVSGGLAGLTSLQVPAMFGEGEGEMKALSADLARARKSLRLFRSVERRGMAEQQRITMEYFEAAAQRTMCICMAAMEYRRGLAAARDGSPRTVVASHLRASLDWVLEDYRIVREHSFDLSEEFHQRILDAVSSVSVRLSKYGSAVREKTSQQPAFAR